MSVAVSVVIPVYNTARYLKQCLDSLINQSLKDVEYIFVDDGSTDNSVDILEQYQKKDERIKILRQKNLYAGVARNNGIQEARGKYIMFLDSDDFFETNMLRDTYRYAEKNRAEIVMFRYRLYDEQLQTFTYKSFRSLIWGRQFPKGVFSADDLGENLFISCNPAPWNKLYLREFLDAHQLRFQAVKKCNDTYFVYMSLAFAKRIVMLNKAYVNYRINNQDSLQGARNMKRESYLNAAISLKNGLKEAGIFGGGIKKSEVKFAQGFVNLSVQPPYTEEALQTLYIYAKEHMVPDLFESSADLQESYTAKNIHESSDFVDFLFKQLESERMDKDNNCIRAASLEARIGRRVLSFPIGILRLLKR